MTAIGGGFSSAMPTIFGPTRGCSVSIGGGASAAVRSLLLGPASGSDGLPRLSAARLDSAAGASSAGAPAQARPPPHGDLG